MKTYFCITATGEIRTVENTEKNETMIDRLDDLDNLFETEKDALFAQQKLYAWRRLEQNGFRFVDFEIHGVEESGEDEDGFEKYDGAGDGAVWFEFDHKPDTKDLKLLFGVEK